MKAVFIMDVPVHPVTNNEMYGRLMNMMEESRVHTVMTPNPEMIMSAQENPELMNALCGADLVIPDGIGLIIASKIRKIGLRERVTGIDTMEKILQICHEKKKKIFLLGGKPGRSEKAIENIQGKYSGITGAAGHHGYFGEKDNKGIIDLINQHQPDVIFVCLGFPRQEVWIHNHQGYLNCKIVMGAGGSVDVYAGEVKRAPGIFQKFGMEWLYRLIQEPARIRRMSVLPLFLWKSLWMSKKRS